jgi:hypothetical protein
MENIRKLQSMELAPQQLACTAIHPALGEITGAHLLSTWLVHDLDHLAQICRVMAKQYKTETGPFIQYLRILKQ